MLIDSVMIVLVSGLLSWIGTGTTA